MSTDWKRPYGQRTTQNCSRNQAKFAQKSPVTTIAMPKSTSCPPGPCSTSEARTGAETKNARNQWARISETTR